MEKKRILIVGDRIMKTYKHMYVLQRTKEERTNSRLSTEIGHK